MRHFEVLYILANLNKFANSSFVKIASYSQENIHNPHNPCSYTVYSISSICMHCMCLSHIEEWMPLSFCSQCKDEWQPRYMTRCTTHLGVMAWKSYESVAVQQRVICMYIINDYSFQLKRELLLFFPSVVPVMILGSIFTPLWCTYFNCTYYRCCDNAGVGLANAIQWSLFSSLYTNLLCISSMVVEREWMRCRGRYLFWLLLHSSYTDTELLSVFHDEFLCTSREATMNTNSDSGVANQS